MKEEMAVGIAFEQDEVRISCSRGAKKEPVTIVFGEEEQEALKIPADVWDEAVGRKEDTGALAEFVRTAFEKAGIVPDETATHVMASVPTMERPLWENVISAIEKNGIIRKHIYVQDRLAAFYYYEVNQKKDLRSGDVALLEYRGGEMIGYVMSVDRSKTPALVHMKENARKRIEESMRRGRALEEWEREKDNLLFAFLTKTFERQKIATIYLVSDYCDRSWAKKSFNYLGENPWRAFQAKNLYTKGACFAAMERMGQIHTTEYLYMGTDILRNNLAMSLRVRGRETVVPLINAGINWYEAHFECEIIPENDKTITLMSIPMQGGPSVSHVLRLDHFPERPDRATRLKMSLYYTAPDICEVEIEDLGFGNMYRSSGQVWTRQIRFLG